MFAKSSIKKVIFPENKLQFVHEHRVDKNKSFFAIYVKLGSALENSKQKGLCHLVEHLMFKSSIDHTTLELAKELEKYGAQVNAYTSFDSICFHFSVLNEHFVKCFNIFTEMFLRKNITAEEFELEKNVVLQEYYMDQDSPMVLCGDAHYKHYFGLDPVIGFEKTIKSFTLGDVNNFINTYFTPKNMTISAVTNHSHRFVKKLVKKAYVDCFKCLYDSDVSDLWARYVSTKSVPKNSSNILVDQAKTQHIAVQITVPTILPVEEIVYGPYFSVLFSAGLSSVLFREVREKKGLCYGVHLDVDTFDEPHLSDFFGTTLSISTSTEPEKVPELLQTVESVLNHLPALLTHEDIERTNNFFKSEYVSASRYGFYNAINFNIKGIKGLDANIKKRKHMTLKQITKAYKKYVLHNGTVKCFTTLRGPLKKKQLNKLPKYTNFINKNK